jgi:transcriptional regulator with XRE-family HTH domain
MFIYKNLLFVYKLCYNACRCKLLAMEVNVQRLRELRRQKVLSMRELEEMSGVSYNTIWRLETGKTGAQPRTIRRIAAALGVDPAELVKEEE